MDLYGGWLFRKKQYIRTVFYEKSHIFTPKQYFYCLSSTPVSLHEKKGYKSWACAEHYFPQLFISETFSVHEEKTVWKTPHFAFQIFYWGNPQKSVFLSKNSKSNLDLPKNGVFVENFIFFFSNSQSLTSDLWKLVVSHVARLVFGAELIALN